MCFLEEKISFLLEYSVSIENHVLVDFGDFAKIGQKIVILLGRNSFKNTQKCQIQEVIHGFPLSILVISAQYRVHFPQKTRFFSKKRKKLTKNDNFEDLRAITEFEKMKNDDFSAFSEF